MGTSWMFLYEAYQKIGVSYASLMYYCGPVIVMILSPLLFKEKLTFQKITGFLIVIVGIKQAFVIHVPASSWPWILVLGLVNTGIGCYLYFSSLSKLPVQTVAICGYLEPLSAVVFAALLLGEKLSATQYIGALCIIGGALMGVTKTKGQNKQQSFAN